MAARAHRGQGRRAPTPSGPAGTRRGSPSRFGWRRTSTGTASSCVADLRRGGGWPSGRPGDRGGHGRPVGDPGGLRRHRPGRRQAALLVDELAAVVATGSIIATDRLWVRCTSRPDPTPRTDIPSDAGSHDPTDTRPGPGPGSTEGVRRCLDRIRLTNWPRQLAAAPSQDAVLSDLRTMIIEVIGEDYITDTEIDLDTSSTRSSRSRASSSWRWARRSSTTASESTSRPGSPPSRSTTSSP